MHTASDNCHRRLDSLDYTYFMHPIKTIGLRDLPRPGRPLPPRRPMLVELRGAARLSLGSLSRCYQAFIQDFTSGGVSKNQGVPPLPPPFPFPPFPPLSLPTPPLPSLPLEVGP